MNHPLVREQTPAEYFKELVESAMARQHLQAADLTEYYLVNLLCQYVRLDRAAARLATCPCIRDRRYRTAASPSRYR